MHFNSKAVGQDLVFVLQSLIISSVKSLKWLSLFQYLKAYLDCSDIKNLLVIMSVGKRY